MGAVRLSFRWLRGSCSAEFLAGFDPKVPPDPHQGPGLPQTLEWEGVGEEPAPPQCWLVAVVVLGVEVAQVAPQLQGVEGVVGQNVQWLEGVVVEGHLGLGEAVPEESVAAEQPPQVQGAVDQNGPC